jgi:hypothetical protein
LREIFRGFLVGFPMAVNRLFKYLIFDVWEINKAVYWKMKQPEKPAIFPASPKKNTKYQF